jgi:predicted enzyme related to lactoylglutathione lyase
MAEKLGGKIVMPRTGIHYVGFVAVIEDTEGNVFGLWKPPVWLMMRRGSG